MIHPDERARRELAKHIPRDQRRLRKMRKHVDRQVSKAERRLANIAEPTVEDKRRAFIDITTEQEKVTRAERALDAQIAEYNRLFAPHHHFTPSRSRTS